MRQIKRVLISVFDKSGLIELGSVLHKLGCEIISTGGTASFLKERGIPITQVADLTGFPEMLEGRVKTLHPRIHAGILAKRIPEHLQELDKHQILPIDMVVVNLYPFEKIITRPDVTKEEAIEQIDIGGSTLIRAAAKNHKYIASVTNPDQYERITNSLLENNGRLSLSIRELLAYEAFAYSALYDATIANYLTEETGQLFPEILNLRYQKITDLRYGENPHQQAAFYKELSPQGASVSTAEKLQGKELSFNNILDLNAAWELVREFEDQSAVVIIKHTNPCGVAIDESQVMAYKKALSTDPVSAFGGIVGFNQHVTEETAKALIDLFTEAIIAPGYDDTALQILKDKKNLRLLRVKSDEGNICTKEIDLRKVSGGLLVQEKDTKPTVGNIKQQTVGEMALKIVTERKPSREEIKDLIFAWKVVKHVKSNAIVLVRGHQTIGIGAGQMSRVDAVRLAISKANVDTNESSLASDAFFPFPDSIKEAAKAGVTAIIQPGGSVRDEEVIQMANAHNITMIFTSYRHFRH